MTAVPFKSTEDDYITEIYQDADNPSIAIYRDHATEAIIDVWIMG